MLSRYITMSSEANGTTSYTLEQVGKVNRISLLSSDAAESPATIAYMSAYELLSKGDSGASQAFAAVVGEYGDDPLATFHLQRLLAGETGVEIVLSEK